MPPADYIDDDEDYDEANLVEDDQDDEEAVPEDTQDDDTADDDDLPEHMLSPAKREIARQEKERLKQQAKAKKEMLEKMRTEQMSNASAGEDDRTKNRLNFLLKQAEIFQHFVPETHKAGNKKASRGRAASKAMENDEDAELLKDEEDGGERAGHRLSVQPSIITGGTLREYQMQGLNWLIHLYDNGINGILADEMGLGKTLQTISLCAYLYEYRGIKGPHMVIVPKSTMGNWCNEFKRFCPVIKVAKFHGNQEERERQKEQLLQPGKFDVVVTSYEMVIKEKNHLKRFHWRYIIIDEAHRIKNENSMLSKVVRIFHTNYRLLITGTPLQNNLHELWALLNFLLPEVFSSAEKFEEWFSLGDGGKEKEAEVVEQLHKVLRPFLLRRIKSDVERGLPPKKETILKIGMSEVQRKWYAALLQKDLEALSGGSDRSKLLNVVMQLRKCCNHPYLFQGAEPGPPFFTGEHLVENSGKMVLLDKLLVKLRERDSRVLIFSQMTRMLDILEDYCLYRGYKYCRIDGNTAGDDRENSIEAFNAPNSEKFIFLLSTRAGGLGINLATADIVVLYDSDWNPQMDLQAMDRAHRIGQKKEVQVFRFCIENGIEEKVIEKAYKKLRLDALVIQQGRLTDNSQAKLGKDDLISMVRYGAEHVFSTEPTNITAADIDIILTKGERDTQALNDKMQSFTDNAHKFTMDGGIDNVYEFKDEEEDDNPEFNFKQLVGNHWVDPPKRERKRLLNYTDHTAKGKAERAVTTVKLAKMPQFPDYQFFNVPRLTQIYTKEDQWDKFKAQQAEKEKALRNQGAAEDAIQAALVPAPDDPQPLTAEEIQEREELLQEGFKDWSRKDFNAFIRSSEKYGRDQLHLVAADIEGKSVEDVKAYSRAFWDNYRDLKDWEKVIGNVEKGEQKIQRQADIMNNIAAKLDKYKNPWQEMKFVYGANKGKSFTEDEDRFIICMVHKLGYGAWDDLKSEIKRSWRFRFDWFMKSRLPLELQRRCDTLIRCIEREFDDAAGGEARKSVPQRRASAKTGAPGEEEAGEGGRPTTGRKKRGQSTPVPDSEGSPPPQGKRPRV